MKTVKNAALVTTIVGFALIVQGAALYALGARVNTSASIPLGLYWTSSAPVDRGRYVIFCPPEVEVMDDALRRGYIGPGYCPGGYGYMMKRVAAATDDEVSVADDGVRVNGRLWPASAPRKVDGNGQPLPRYQHEQYVLSDNELLLMADVNPKSFDSRYFGPVLRAQVSSVIVPVFTW